ncbi:unnamed protein product [Orchesella dallaii]|uniref:EGF-like domain-containing protein n=1 Tax=Orchesella dallaii TaxID=48710 RepID=A0ABP1QLB6_9HEXA
MNALKVTVFTALLVSFTALSQAIEYGQLCDITVTPDECRSVNVLDPIVCTNVIINGTDFAVCACEDGMFRHEDLNYCVSPHLGKCTIQSNDGQPIHKCTKFAHCFDTTTRANERKEGKCYCEPDTVPDGVSGHCKLTHGSNRCTVPTDCNVQSILTCRQGSCVCEDEEYQVWNKTSGKCEALIAGSCTANLPFPKPDCNGRNTHCNNITETEFICQCLPGYTEAPDKSCYKEFEGECEINDDCHPQFECKGNPTKQCLCPDGQIYHDESKTCRILVGQQCALNSTLECTIHAACINNNCTCTQGFIGVNGTCFAQYGSECSEVGCYGSDFLQCSNTTTTCDCVPNYQAENNRCVGLIGQSCRNSNDDCVGNSICLQNQCGCSDGQESLPNLIQCVALHGQSCDGITVCKTDSFLTCTDSTCNCNNPLSQTYEESRRTCVGMADRECLGVAELCVGNSSCSPLDNTNMQRICKCNQNFASSKEGLCVQANGSSNVVTSGVMLSILLMVTQYI